MQNYHLELGEMRSVYRPATIHLWLMAIPLLGLLFPFSLFAFIIAQGDGKTFERASDPFICLGILILLLVVVGGVWASDFRKWSATKTAKLSIYQSGFTYESKGQTETCRWDEIEKLKFKKIAIDSNVFTRQAKVIRSIVKKDGTVISLAETLRLEEITAIINKAKSEVG